MAITLKEIDGTLRSYRGALKNNKLNKKDKEDCINEIQRLEKLRADFLRRQQRFQK